MLRKKFRAVTDRFLADFRFRTKTSLVFNVSMNLLFSLYHVLLGIVYDSLWFIAISAYYSLLLLVRSMLLLDTLRENVGGLRREWGRFHITGWVLLTVNVALSFVVFYIVRHNKGFSYHYIHTIALATYTFAVTAIAIRGVIKYRCAKSPLISAVKYVSMTSSLVSMLSLETAMLSAFGQDRGEEFRQTMTALTGSGVCIIVLAIGVYMIIKSAKSIKDIQECEKRKTTKTKDFL